MNELRLPDMDDDEPSITPLAFMHRTSDSCVTPAVGDHPELIYENPRVLVAWDDVADAVDWLEKGIAEWRAYAIEARKQLAHLRKLTEAQEQLIAVLYTHGPNHPQTHTTEDALRKTNQEE